MDTKSTRCVCPDCGEQFSARGLAGHRRLRHGISPAPALPRDADQMAEGIAAIMSALLGLQDSMLRVEQRVIAMKAAAAQAETPAVETDRLRRELGELLENIALLKQTGLAATTIRRPASEAEVKATLELARLRREQARIVFRLEELRSGKPNDDRFLA